MSESGKNGALPKGRTQPAKAVDACSVHLHGVTEIKAEQSDRATDDAERTSTSLRAAKAYRDWSLCPPSERPLLVHRAAHARVLFELLRDHQCSRAWLALQLGVDAKHVQKMLKAEIGIPVTVLSCLPDDMRADYLERLGTARPSLQDRIDRLDRAGLLDALSRITIALGAK